MLNNIKLLLLALFVVTACTDNVLTDETFTLQGKVTSDHNGSVISNAQVILNEIVVDTTDENGSFIIEGLINGEYTLQVNSVRDHRLLIIRSLIINNNDLNLDLALPFKYNKIESIVNSLSVIRPNNLIGSYMQQRAPTIFNDSSKLSIKFEDYILASDTIEFSYYHTERPAFNFGNDYLFDHGMRIIGTNTSVAEIISIRNFNDEIIRTVKLYPISLASDSTNEFEISIIPDQRYSINELNLLYLTSY